MEVDAEKMAAAVKREVLQTEHDGEPARVVEATRTYATDIEDLWDAVTTAERIPRWLMPVSGELKLGGRYQLHGNASGTVTDCEPPRYLGLTWEHGGNTSWVEGILEAVSEKETRLKVRHIAVVDDEIWDQFGPGAVGIGWDMMLMGLELYMESGQANDPREAMEWMGSPNGIEFMTRSNDSWRDASIAGGEDEAKARASAERCLGAYTGVPPAGDSADG